MKKVRTIEPKLMKRSKGNLFKEKYLLIGEITMIFSK
jgi:hypothetical protein